MKTVIDKAGREFEVGTNTRILKVPGEELTQYYKLRDVAGKMVHQSFFLALLYACLFLLLGAIALIGSGRMSALTASWLFFGALALFCYSLRPDAKGRRARRMAENHWDQMVLSRWRDIDPDEVDLGVGKPHSKYLLQCADPPPISHPGETRIIPR